MRAADTDETPRPGETAEELVERLARAKAAAVWERLTSGTAGLVPPVPVVLGADTVIATGGGNTETILGKPASRSQGREMLAALSGTTHRSVTGHAVMWNYPQPLILSVTSTTLVTFRELGDTEIDRYLASGEADDKAGAYAVQGRAAAFVERIDGSHSAIVGLDLTRTRELLQQTGITLP